MSRVVDQPLVDKSLTGEIEMKRLAMLATGLVLTVGLAAQPGEAHAMMQQCTGNGELTVGEDGTTSCGTTPTAPREVSFTAVTQDNFQVKIDTLIPDADEVMEEGDYVEVEIIYDEMAAINGASDDIRVEYSEEADAKGVTPDTAKRSVVRVTLPASARNHELSNGDFEALISESGQSRRATGRSDPARAGDSRWERTVQAVTRAIGNLRRAVLPQFGGRYHERTVRTRDREETERTIEFEVG